MTNPSDSETQVEWVSEDIIRQIFNDHRIYELVKDGILRTYLKRNSHPTNPEKVGQPYCTWSQIVIYYDKNDKPVAIVHQYLRPDGKLGASGLPDPKRIFLENRIISVRAKNKVE
jgi:hypothetical protein